MEVQMRRRWSEIERFGAETTENRAFHDSNAIKHSR